MNKIKTIAAIAGVLLLASTLLAQTVPPLQSLRYREDFESGELNAWATYPLWQDTAFDPNIRPGWIVAGDPNISLLLRVTPFAPVDQFAGAQKKIDAWIEPGAVLKFRYYLKTNLPAESLKVRLAAGSLGALEAVFPNPPTNSWGEWTVKYDDLLKAFPALSGQAVRVYGIAVLAKIPKGDPAMPIYLGLDDVDFRASAAARFRFAEPRTIALPEWEAVIPERSYRKGDILRLLGDWPFAATSVNLTISPYGDPGKILLKGALKKAGNAWELQKFALALDPGLYLARLTAASAGKAAAETPFTVLILPANAGKTHPRLWFDAAGLKRLLDRSRDVRFTDLRKSLTESAKGVREKNPVEKIGFDLDRFPADEPLLGNVPRSIYPWFDRITPWRNGLHDNTWAFVLSGDEEAGAYAKALLLKLSEFPFFVHPWFEKRGQHIYYPVGELGMDMALSYDLLYDRLNEQERASVRQALKRNIIYGAHRGYVEDNLVTSQTSNWVAHVVGGSLLAQAAIFGDDPKAGFAEPYLTGALMKMAALVDKSTGRDGGYGESLGYCTFTMLSWSKVLPALENVFGVDISARTNQTYADLPYAGIIQDKRFFHFGDSSGTLGPLTNWAWLLAKNKDPLLAWAYGFLKKDETLMDLVYDTGAIQARDPFKENPVRLFRDIGTTVFRGGWNRDDFVFVLRTGPFYNHQHLDQGTFWLADRGEVFIEEKTGSTYYDDPVYQSHYIQPIAHSTILVDKNIQSQRTGDPRDFIPGFNDYAFVGHFLDGRDAAYVSGDLGKLYGEKIQSLRRNALFLKPRAVLMVDVAVPAGPDVDISLLYQARRLDEIRAGAAESIIRKPGANLRIRHLAPAKPAVGAVEMPPFINNLKAENPLVRSGYLSLTARTAGKQPLVIANLLTTLEGDDVALPAAATGEPLAGKVQDTSFAVSVKPGETAKLGPWTTDALAAAWKEKRVLAAEAKTLAEGERPILRSAEPMTLEYENGWLKYYLEKPSAAAVVCGGKPKEVRLNGKAIKNFTFDPKTRELRMTLPAGEGTLTWK